MAEELKVTVALLREDDLESLGKLYEQLTGRIPAYARLLRGYKRAMENPNYILLGAYLDDGTLVGTTSLSRCFDLTDDCLDYYSMENFVVDEAYRGRGVGTAIIHTVEGLCRATNVRYISFTSSASRIEAHRFYENLGYDPNKAKAFKKVFKEG